MNRKILIFFLVSLCIFGSTSYGDDPKIVSFSNEKARVEEVISVKEKEGMSGLIEKVQILSIKILSGEHKGELVEIENPISSNYAYNIEVEKGDKVLVGIEVLEDDMADIYITSFLRQNEIFIILVIFMLLIALIGGKKGIKSIFTLIMTLFLVVKVFLPLILKGVNPIPVSIGISILMTVITLFVISGVNAKSISAIIGTCSGVLIAGLISYIVGTRTHITGLSAEEATALMNFHENIDFTNLLFSGIIIGALGAIMDVGMSIASSIDEVYKANNKLSRKDLFRSGMNVGRDIMGTMTNTLILAYTGSSIPLLLLFMSYDPSMIKLLNLDIIATEIIRSISGSIGLVLTIPLTALVATILINKNIESKTD